MRAVRAEQEICFSVPHSGISKGVRSWRFKNRAETYTIWHRQLTIVGEAWRNEYRFFTAHDVESGGLIYMSFVEDLRDP